MEGVEGQGPALMERGVETCCPGREGCEGSPHTELGAGSLVDVCPDPWGRFGEVGLFAHLDSVLGCQPLNQLVAFLPSLLLIVSAE